MELLKPPILYKVKETLTFIKKIYQIYPGKLLLGYNGGKDSTVLLQLIQNHFKIPIVHFQQEDPFPELLEFLSYRLSKTSLPIIRKSSDIKSQMKNLVEQGYQSVILGQRSTDPNSPSAPLTHSTQGWPFFEIVNPLFNWSYSQVWEFILSTNSQFCPLYRYGYSSIGPRSKTEPNPFLKGRPAWELNSLTEERTGRLK